MRPQTEANFLAQVLALLRLRGWRAAHFRGARSRAGWRTPCQADAKGFPDVLACRGRRCVALELKVGKNKLTPEQSQWLACLAAAGVEAWTVRPEDWPRLEAILA